MHTSTDMILTTFDSVARRLNPINTLIDRVANWIAPITTVNACGGVICSSNCIPPDTYWCGFSWLVQTQEANNPMDCPNSTTGCAYCTNDPAFYGC